MSVMFTSGVENGWFAEELGFTGRSLRFPAGEWEDRHTSRPHGERHDNGRQRVTSMGDARAALIPE